jgi:hypothetical protein
MGDERGRIAVIVLLGSIVFDGLALLLFTLGGVAVLWAIVCLAFGIMGCVQALAIAFGRDGDDDPPRPH